MEALKSKEFYNTPKVISGIDSLYYFCETNQEYDNLFLDILDQIEDAKGRFEKKDIKYENKDISVILNHQPFFYNGKAEGFYWLTHKENYLTMGFKDHMTNRGLNDIRVQLDARGIYTLGITPLIKYIDELLAEYITGYKPITRIDLNIFVQSDLSWITKDMFVSRKRKFTTIFKEVANKHRLETLYAGKTPFLMRLYDKQAELKKSNKKEMMYAYYAFHGFDVKDEIFNVEFEVHRTYLKTFKIDTVDDALERAELLFKDCLDSVRLVDLSTLVDNSKKQKNKYRAETHLLWEHLKDSYKLQGFYSIDAPLERIKRKSYTYTITDCINDFIPIARRFYIHGGIIDKQFYNELEDAFYNTIKPKIVIEDSKGVEYVYENVTTNINPRDLDDIELEKYLVLLYQDLENSDDLDIHVLNQKYQTAFVELQHRGLKNPIEYPF